MKQNWSKKGNSCSNKVNSPYFAGHKPGKNANMGPNQYRNFYSVRQNEWLVEPPVPVVEAILAEVVVANFAGVAEVVAANFAVVAEVAAASFAVVAVVAEVVEGEEGVAVSRVEGPELLVVARHPTVFELELRVSAVLPNDRPPEMK